MSAKHLGGYVEFTRAVDSIRVGSRQRTDLGDLTELTESIRQHGLLQPITVTPDGLLICGARRLAAIRRLEYRTVSVWVRAISGRLGVLLAEQDENRLHKPLTTLEAAALYAELKAVYAAEAARRQKLTRFAAANKSRPDAGALDSAAPDGERIGTARRQAARIVAGRDASTRFEQVLALQRLADEDGAPAAVREAIAGEVLRIDAGAPVSPAVHRIKAQLELSRLDARVEDPDADVNERRLLRQKAQRGRLQLADVSEPAMAPERPGVHASSRRRERPTDGSGREAADRFDAVWQRLDRWWTEFDATALGMTLTDEQWWRFVSTVEGTKAFVDEATTARRRLETVTLSR